MLSVTILGYGISARSTIDFLLQQQPAIEIKVSELRVRDQFDDIAAYEAKGVQFEFGKQSRDFVLASPDVFVMISPGIPPHAPIIKAVRESGCNYGTDLDLFLQFAPGKKIAVTGTNGKTTTASLIAHLFDTQALGNIGLPFLEFIKLKNQDIFVLEISSAQAFYSKPKLDLDCSVYLNFTDDHLDWHSSLEEYREAKAKLFQHDGVYVLNQDDKVAKVLANKRSLLFSTEIKTDAYYKDQALYYQDQKIIACDDLNLVGKHNFSNVLAALLVAKKFGLSDKEIQTKLKTFKPVPHRLEYIATINGHKAYNDSKATNPDSAIKALESFDKCIAIVGGKDKNLNLKPFITILKLRAAQVIAIGELRDQIIAALDREGFRNSIKAESLEQAVSIAIAHDSNLPIVLVPASSSFDMFKNYQDRGDKFRQLIYTKLCGSYSTSQ